MGPKERLNIYIENLSDEPFEWGINDCFTFTNGAFRAMYGKGYADDWSGRYLLNNGQPKHSSSMRSEFKASTLEQGLSRRLRKVEAPSYGCLVTTKKNQRWVTGAALGISLGSRCVFLSKDGLIKLNIEDIESAWVPEW